MDDLRKWTDKKSKYITIKSGESFQGIFADAKIVQSNWNPEQSTVAYRFDDKIFNSMSRGLAEKMKDIRPGSLVRVAKFGDGAKTKYSVDVLATPEEVLKGEEKGYAFEQDEESSNENG